MIVLLSSINDLDDLSRSSSGSRKSRQKMEYVERVLNRGTTGGMDPYHTHMANWNKIL
jgi:hypothetical protein